MKYMLLIYVDEAKGAQIRKQVGDAEMSAPYIAYTEALQKAGVIVGGDRLQPTGTATTVRVSDGKTQVLNGPYAETREQLAGYYMIDVPDLDQALSWAARCPGAAHGTVEVRPLWTMARDPRAS
ncbi:YciI family protein [Dongia sp. agr-C8]